MTFSDARLAVLLLRFYETSSSGQRIRWPALGQIIYHVFLSHRPGQYLCRRGVLYRFGERLIARRISRANKPFPPHGSARALLEPPAEPYGPGTPLIAQISVRVRGWETHLQHITAFIQSWTYELRCTSVVENIEAKNEQFVLILVY